MTVTSSTSNKNKSTQIVSKKRVAEHGEVYTNEREVKAMCDLVKDQTERLDSRFLEPACGNGNFLVEILKRKLSIVEKKYKKSILEFEKNSLIAVSSIYGVELLSDNASECRKRLFEIWEALYKKLFKKNVRQDFYKVIDFILQKNILCGNALTLKKVDECACDTDEPIIFCEWSFTTGSLIKRRDFRFDELLRANTATKKSPNDLFDNEPTSIEYDEDKKAFIPVAIKEYSLCDYRKIYLQEGQNHANK